MRTSALFSALVLLALLPACGNGKPPESTNTKDAAAESFAEVKPEDLAELGGDAGLAGAPDAAASAPTASTASAPPPPDECTPVGVDFEKRARPKLKDCYAAGKKKDPDLKGSVKIAVEIDTLGKVKSTKVIEKTLPEAVTQCMLKVVKATPLPDAAKCPAKTLTIPMTFPTPP